jgi:hypothetical protein
MLTQEQDRMLRELHAAMVARRSASTPSTPRPTVGQAVAATGPKSSHDPADPVVKLQPRGWKGPDMRGKHYSECPAPFLAQLAHLLDGCADRNEADPERQRYAKWDRENAETARRWRARLEGKADLFDAAQPKREPADQAVLDEAF